MGQPARRFQGGAPGGAPANPLLRRGGITGGNEITAIAATDDGVYFGTLGNGSVYRYTAARGVEEYWKAPMGAVYSLMSNDGALYAGCDGGDVWRLSGTLGDVRAARVLDATQPQVLWLWRRRAKPFTRRRPTTRRFTRLARGSDGKGNEYDSDIFDAKGVVRWGALRTLGEGVTIQTRSGNTTDPDATWSDWAALDGDKIASPTSRYLQYRAILGENGTLSRVEALYRAPNRAPKVVWTAPAGGEAFSGKKTLTWKGTDPDGDTLRYNVEIAGSDGAFKAVDDPTPTDNKVEVDTAKLGDGSYRARVRASDAARNPDDPQSDSTTSLPFTVDNTAPSFFSLSFDKIADGWQLNGIATDATSPLAGAEWRIKPAEAKKADAKKDKGEETTKETPKPDVKALQAAIEKAKAEGRVVMMGRVPAGGTTGRIPVRIPAKIDEKDMARVATVAAPRHRDDDEDSDDETETSDTADAAAKAKAKAAAKARSDWQAIGASDGVFDSKNEVLIAILDSAFAPAPLQSGMEIEFRLRDAAGNQTVKTLKLP